MTVLRRAHEAAREIARSSLGHDPGPMRLALSNSHYVYVSREAVVKLIGASGHTRLNREIAVIAGLSPDIAAELLGWGQFLLGSDQVRYACLRTVHGASPQIGLPGVDQDAALILATQAVERLQRLHDWRPANDVEVEMRKPMRHGGFLGRQSLQVNIGEMVAQDDGKRVHPSIVSALRQIASCAPLSTNLTVPVHADCHWGNWLAQGPTVTALLDFEWARFGEPVDDWFFLARFSGSHQAAVLETIARLTDTAIDDLRAGCEVREAAYLVSDLLSELTDPGSDGAVASIVQDLERLTVGRSWWVPFSKAP